MANKKKILIVEDQDYAREAIKKILINYGYNNIKEAADGVTAIEEYKLFLPDIVLLDLRLPKISGLDLIPLFLKNRKEVKVLVVTADESPETKKTAIEKGAFDYITKPVDEKMLISKIDEFLKSDALITQDIVNILVTESVKYSDKFHLKLNIEKLIQTICINDKIDNSDMADLYKTIISIQDYNYRNLILNLQNVPEYNIDFEKFKEVKNIVDKGSGQLFIVATDDKVIEMLDNIGFKEFIISEESIAFGKVN